MEGDPQLRERADRLQKLADEADSILREVGPRLIRLAHVREEARLIIEELGGQTPDVA